MKAGGSCKFKVMGFLAGLLIFLGTAFAPAPLDFEHSDYGVIQLPGDGYSRAYSVAFSPDGSLLAAGTSQGIYLFNARSFEQIMFIPTENTVRSLAFSPDGVQLASTSYDPLVRLWKVADGELMQELKGHSAWVRDVTYSPDANLLATASDDDSVMLWDPRQGLAVLQLEEHTQGVRAVAFSPDGTMLATGGFDKLVRIWKVSDGALIRELSGHTDWVRTLAFSPDGQTLASGAFDATIRLWRVADGALLVTKEEHSSSVLDLAFSPDGSLLASASVDTEVRLWKMPYLTAFDRMVGHSGFVYGTSFSPDGKTLASASADNSVRWWNVPLEPDATAFDRIATPSSCKACHHPLIDTLAPRVVETGCAICHRNGALVRTWCPILNRDPGPTSSDVTYSIQDFEGGVPHGGSGIGVQITSPGNGEHFYTPREILTSIRINGRVFSEVVRMQDIRLQIELWSGDQLVSSLAATPGADGNFSFSADIRPEGGEPHPDLDGQKFNCLNCHKSGDISLPSGKVRIVVTATLPDGKQAYDERIVYVDDSTSVSIPVQVLDEEDQPLVGIPLQSTARLYEWRGRSFNALSELDGRTTLEVEALSQIPTKYKVQVPPVLLRGLLYESVEAVDVLLSPGVAPISPVTVHVRSSSGSLTGQLVPPSVNSVRVSAIHLPEGSIFEVTSETDGFFSFRPLPIGQYLVVANQEDLLSQGLAAQPQEVDMTQSVAVSINLPLDLVPGGSIPVRVREAGGSFLPFAYLMANSLDLLESTAPDSGEVTLPALPSEPFTLIVSAPGYFSQAHVVNAADTQSRELNLVRRPDVRSLPWGVGQVTIPSETVLNVRGLNLALERGWLWGSGGGGEHSLQITQENVEIEMESGSFALESIPGENTWFFVFEGQAQLNPGPNLEPVILSEGQMVVLVDGIQPTPVPYNPVVVAVMHPHTDLPLNLVWQPSLQAQFRDRLAKVGISTAQSITLLGYIMAMLILLAIPILLVRRSIRGMNQKGNT